MEISKNNITLPENPTSEFYSYMKSDSMNFERINEVEITWDAMPTVRTIR